MSIGGRSAVASNGPRRQSGGQWCRRRESGYPHVLKTDFFTRSFDTGWHPAYDALVDKVMSVVTDPKQMATYSTPEQIAEVVYEAATDGKDQLRYVAGADAKAMYAMRLQVGDEAFAKRSMNNSSHNRESLLSRGLLRAAVCEVTPPTCLVSRLATSPKVRFVRNYSATARPSRAVNAVECSRLE